MKKDPEQGDKLLEADAVRETAHAHEDEPSGFSIPEFRTREEFDAWWDALPKVKAEVDPRLKERIKTSIRLSRRTIEGFDFLAKKKGIRSGQTLMKIVLDNYLAKNLPEDF